MARPKEFNEESALAAALEVFWEKGYEAASVQDLTERMGIQKASLYNTFGDKHALFVRALAAYQAETLEWYRVALERAGPVRRTLKALFDRLARGPEKGRSCRGCFCVNAAVELAPHDPAIAALLERHDRAQEELFRQLLDRGRHSGEMRRDLDVTATARFLLNAITGIAVARKSGAPRPRLDDVVRITLSVLDPQ
jgi:TetR/AcrR family transcriptional repressor of nem operon